MNFIKAENKDLDFLFNLRNDPLSAKYSKRGIITIEEAKTDYLDNKKKRVYIAKQDNNSVGYLIFEYLYKGIFEISIAISPEYRGQGLGKVIAKEGTEFGLKKLKAKKIIAQIFSANKASLKIFDFYKLNKNTELQTL